MSIARAPRLPRISLKLSRSWLTSTPWTGIAILRVLRRAKSPRSGGGAGSACGGVGTSGTAMGASACGAHGAGEAKPGVTSNAEAAEDGAETAENGGEGEANESRGNSAGDEAIGGRVVRGTALEAGANGPRTSWPFQRRSTYRTTTPTRKPARNATACRRRLAAPGWRA